jgi:CysZ protein
LAIFLANWIFVLLTALIASPFNDIISSRIAKKIKGQQQGNLEQATESMFKRMFKTFVNEAKKIIIIAAVSTIAVVFGYIPPLIPVSIIIAFILISIQFVDYSWSRDGLATGACFRDVLGNIFFYIPAGAIFFLMINIPLMNLFVPAIATSYYTNYWEKRKLN